jgi:hypothetical protein
MDEVVVSLPEDRFPFLTKPIVRILDITGRLQVAFPLSASQQRLDIGALPPGLYFVTIEGSGRAVGIQKLVKW